MTLEELAKRIEEIKDRYDNDLNKIKKEYAISNNPYKIGDIVEDHIGRIKIESIKICSHSGLSNEPECVYYGLHLTKKNEPKKTQDNRGVYQKNVKRRIE